MANSVFPHIDVETWTFDLEKVEFLLSLTDGEYTQDQTWALISGAKALCAELRAKMDKASEIALERDGHLPAVIDAGDRRRAA